MRLRCYDLAADVVEENGEFCTINLCRKSYVQRLKDNGGPKLDNRGWKTKAEERYAVARRRARMLMG